MSAIAKSLLAAVRVTLTLIDTFFTLRTLDS